MTGIMNPLDLLIEHERAIGRLYNAFAEKLVEHQHFWHNLATEEQSHADRLAQLHASPSLAAWLGDENRLKPDAIKSSIDYVISQTELSRKGPFPQLRALSVARDLESALLEKIFARVGSTVPPDVRSVLMELAADTERHRKAVLAMLENEKKGLSQAGTMVIS